MTTFRLFRRFALAVASLCYFGFNTAHAQPVATSQPTDRASDELAEPPQGEQPFDPGEKLFGDPFGVRSELDAKGIDIDPILLIDYTKVLKGGLNTRSSTVRERFDLPVTLDAEKLFGLKGGTFFIAYQDYHGPNADLRLVGDAQQVGAGINSTFSRNELGQLWYQQTFADDTIRLKVGKMDVNADFDVLTNGQEFLNNSFATSPTLYLMPSFPENSIGAALFWEPKSGFYIGGGAFDGSQARGAFPGNLAFNHTFDRADDLFLIAEAGQKYKLAINGRPFDGKLSVGAWWDTNRFLRLDNAGHETGTGGVYAVCDQILWKPNRAPVPANTPNATVTPQPEQQESPGGVASTFSLAWCDPRVNPIDGNALAGVTWTGAVPTRPIDVVGLGATWAHFSGDYNTRNPYELTFETFYRIRFTRFFSLKPDLQYVIHPTGSGLPNDKIIRDALVFQVRMELSF